jgi:putative phosphoesterase
MNIVVFSDAHGNKDAVKRVVSFNPDAEFIVSLGDTEMSYNFLQDLDIIPIKGNFPLDAGFVYESELIVETKRFFLTHGHKYKVGKGLGKISNKMLKEGYDVGLYGHTHIAKIDKLGSKFVINPGSIRNSRNKTEPSYLVITKEDDKLVFTFKNSETNEVINIVKE